MAISVGDIEVLIKLRDELSKGLKGTESNIGSFVKNAQSSFAVVGTGIAALGGVVAGLATGIAALGARGADVADVAGSFDQLTKAAGGGEAALNTLRTATDGLISNYDLMQSTNLAFGQGLRLTQDQMQLTGESARVLADAVGSDTKQAYETLINAMATGMDRQLKTIGLNIDAADAVQAYANKLGVETSALNENQQIAAKRAAILDAMKAKLGEMGAAELDFGERIQAGKVALENFADGLGVAIAQSPVLNAGLKAVGDAMDQAFGVNQQQTIQMVIGWIEKFAIWLVQAGQTAVEVARFIGNAWYGLNAIFNAFVATVSDQLGMVVGVMLNTAQAASAIMPDLFGGAAADAAVEKLQLAKDFLTGFADSSRQAIAGNVDAAGDFNAAMDTVQGTLDGVAQAMVNASGSQDKMAAGSKAAADGLNTVTGGAKAAADAQKLLEAANQRQVDAWEKSEQAVAEWYAEVADMTAGLTGLTKAQVDEVAKMAMAWAGVKDVTQVTGQALQDFIDRLLALREAGALGAEGVKALAEAQAELARRQAEMQGPLIGMTREQIELIQDQADKTEETIALYDKMGTVISGVTNLLAAFGLSGASAFGQLVEGINAGIEGMMAYASATNNAQKAQALLNTAANIYKQGSALGGAATGAMMGFAVGGPIGAGIGALAGGLLGLFGGAKKAREEMEKLRAQFVQSMGGMDALRQKAQQAGVSLAAMFNAKDAKALQAAIAGIQNQLGLWEQAQEGLQQAMDRYGITITDLGPKFAQQELDKVFAQLFQDYKLLTAAGVDLNTVNEKMAGDINAYVQNAMAAGANIPEAFRPILQSLVDQGLLTDAAGNKLENLEGLTFSETLTESISRIVAAVEQLVDALTRGINASGNLATNLGNLGKPGGYGEGGYNNPKFPEYQHGGVVGGSLNGLPGRGEIARVGEVPEAIAPLEQVFGKLGDIVASRVAAAAGSYTSAPNFYLTSNDPTDAQMDRVLDRWLRNERGEMERLRQRILGTVGGMVG